MTQSRPRRQAEPLAQVRFGRAAVNQSGERFVLVAGDRMETAGQATLPRRRQAHAADRPRAAVVALMEAGDEGNLLRHGVHWNARRTSPSCASWAWPRPCGSTASIRTCPTIPPGTSRTSCTGPSASAAGTRRAQEPPGRRELSHQDVRLDRGTRDAPRRVLPRAAPQRRRRARLRVAACPDGVRPLAVTGAPVSQGGLFRPRARIEMVTRADGRAGSDERPRATTKTPRDDEIFAPR